MNIKEAFDLWLGDQYTKEEIFNTAKYLDNWDRCLDEVDLMISNAIRNNKKTQDHELDDSIRNHLDLVDELKNLWLKEWQEA